VADFLKSIIKSYLFPNMDEITLINLLNKICETNKRLSWKLNCKYSQAQTGSEMEIGLFDTSDDKKEGFITFRMETGKVIRGRYGGMVPFNNRLHLVDALLDILHYEKNRMNYSMN
jgi:hypothetical protein